MEVVTLMMLILMWMMSLSENDDAIEHMNKLASISSLFSNDKKIQQYYLVKLFPFSLKGDAKVWFNSLSYGSIKSPHELLDVFFAKYFLLHMQHAALQRIYNFKQLEDEHLPKAWGRFCSLLRARPVHRIPKNELINIFIMDYPLNLGHTYIVVLVVFLGKGLQMKLKN